MCLGCIPVSHYRFVQYKMFVSTECVERKFLCEVKIGHTINLIYLDVNSSALCYSLRKWRTHSSSESQTKNLSFLDCTFVILFQVEQFFMAWSLSTLMFIFSCRSLKRLGCPHSQTVSYCRNCFKFS